MRDIIDGSDDDDDIGPESMTPDDNSDLLFGADTPGPGAKMENLWPEAAHIFRLWQIYLDRVNPLTKIIHVPSLQPFVANAASGSQNVPMNVEALLFSIFVMAAVSLTPDECRGLLGYSREEALQRFSRGARLRLVGVGFLKSHDLTTLQALVIYLVYMPLPEPMRPGTPLTVTTVLPPGPLQPACRVDSERRRHPHRAEDGVAP